MLSIRSVVITVALGLALTSIARVEADPGTITKYVFPDGRVVYSDTPVAGATAVGEVVVRPQPPQTPPSTPAGPPPEAASDKADVLPPAPDDVPPIIAEARDGKCHLSVASGWQWAEIRMEGLVPGERIIFELRADGRLTLHKPTATPEGESGWVLFPAQLAKEGLNSVTVKSGHCELSASFRWPQ
jgi:hypothetical protein